MIINNEWTQTPKHSHTHTIKDSVCAAMSTPVVKRKERAFIKDKNGNVQ